ncbi:MAG: pentapeptide repeat-containing protein [Cyanobacteria bacterium P01_A01_bin.123]
MQALKGFWQFLNTDVKDIPWGELTEKGIEAVTATNDLGKAFQEHAPDIKALQPYIKQVEPFLKTLDSPITQLAISGLPFVSIGIGLLKIYLGMTKIEPTYESAVTIAAQLAYLQSLEVALKNVKDEAIKTKLKQVSLKTLVEKQLKRLEMKELSSAEAKVVTSRFPESVLAEQFGGALTEQLQQAGLDEAETHRLAEQVVWGTHRYLYEAIAKAGDSVEPLAEVYRTGGRAVQDRYDSIDAYLAEKIAPLPEEQVFDESNPLIRFRDIYVPLEVQPLIQDGEVQRGASRVNIHEWAKHLLAEPSEPRKVMFVQGEAGRGKSVFCRIFADWVRREMGGAYIPLMIRLRNIRTLANNLTKTLTDCPDLQSVDFVQDHSGWLTDRNTRFLLILDGFDELLLEGRTTGGLQEFLQQVVDFQKESHHQCIVTGRPLALQGVDRLITQIPNLERVRLEPMSDALREQWLTNWQAIFEEAEVNQFRKFLEACPDEIADNLAREPLLLYLLARLHREGYLKREMFADIANQEVQAKLRVYRESVNWVLGKQRQGLNLSLGKPEQLRKVLQETALCVVQSGNETARLSMLKDRLKGTRISLDNFVKPSQSATENSDDRQLNKLLTTFYLKPDESDRDGSVEFTHKSFGEYLFAERLKAAFEDWTELDRQGEYLRDDALVDDRIYDLLGYGGLSVEIVEYLFELLKESELNRVKLFERLYGFYQRWCEGEFLDQRPAENWPQKKMWQLADQAIPTGLKQVDVFAGLNVLIVLFKLHAEAQHEDYPNVPEKAPKPEISFHPCGEPETESFNKNQLLKIIYYADSLETGTFTQLVGPHLSSAKLDSAKLDSAKLSNADLSSAKLSNADLSSAKLSNADLSSADLSSADLSSTDLCSTYLSSANLSSAKLDRANLSSANLSSAKLDRANLSSANLSSANLSSANLSSANLGRANLYSANLDSAYLDSAYLDSAKLYSANLSSANLSSAKLYSANLSSAKLSSANLSSANLSLANLSLANLDSANLSSANLSSANHSSANLSLANLSLANLSLANLDSANLSSTNLSSANLSSANLSSANLSSANLSSANLSSANLSSANLSSANLDSAILLETDFREVKDLTEQQLEGKEPPLICGATFPTDIAVDRDRDWKRLPAALRERYPEKFKTLEEAEEFINKRRQTKG